MGKRLQRVLIVLAVCAVAFAVVAYTLMRRHGSDTGALQAVSKRFVSAMNEGDEKTLASISEGDSGSLKLLAAAARSNAARARLVKAATAKYGSAKNILPKQASSETAAFMPGLDASKIQANGSQAVVGDTSDRLRLVKRSDGWKVDRMMMVPAETSPDDTVALADGLTRLYLAVAGEVEAGLLPTAEDARKSLSLHTMEIVVAEGGATADGAKPKLSGGDGSASAASSTLPASRATQ